MKKLLCILLSILICFSTTFVVANAQDTVYNVGDVDMDNAVTVFDVTEIQRYLAKYTALSDVQRELADVDADGYVNIFDATKIQYYIAKLIDKFPVPETQPTEPETEAVTDPATEPETQPTTEAPTEEPTLEPTEEQTEAPTQGETDAPIQGPTQPETEAPTEEPTLEPTEEQTEAPTQAETDAPIQGPTQPETEAPTEEPTLEPTEEQTEAPTQKETDAPIQGPTQPETEAPTEEPTLEPTEEQTEAPTQAETDAPIQGPTQPETEAPTEEPTLEPTEEQTEAPTQAETDAPIQGPTQPQTEAPTQTRPSKVENVTYELTGDSITFTWDDIDSCTKYWVYKYNATTDTWYIAANTTESTATISNLSYNTSYTFKIIGAFSDVSVMSLSDADAVEVTTPKDPDALPEKIENITYEVTENSVTFTWDDIDSCTKYWVYKYNVATDTWAVCAITTDATATITNLSENTTYTFKVIGKFSDMSVMSLSNADTLNVTTSQAPTSSPTTDPCITYAEKLESLQDDNTLTISVMADVHYDENDLYNQKKIDAIKDLGKVQDMVDVDLTCALGDVVVGNADKGTTLSSLNTLLTAYEENCNSPFVMARGNHDDNGWYSYGDFGGTYKTDEIINNDEWWDMVSRNLPQDFVTDEKHTSGGYGYYDHEDSKTRIFMLNSSDIPYITEEEGTYRYNSYQGSCFSNEQLNFVADALMFSDKDEPNEWAALFLVHIPLDTSNENGKRFGIVHALTRGSDYMLAIIDAYRKGTSFSSSGTIHNDMLPNEQADDFKVSVNVDYSQKGAGEAIAFVSGHTHTDNYCDEVGLENSLSYGYSYIGVVGSTSFANIVIDRDDNTVSVLKYGTATPETTDGTMVGKVDSGSIESGEWTIKYNSLFPHETLYTQISEKYPMYYTFDSVSGIDVETGELTNAKEVKAQRVLTKAVKVKPFTTYIIPDDFAGDCQSNSVLGNRQAYVDIVDHGDYKTFTTYQRTAYVVFSFDTGFYKNYDDFYIKELYNDINY